MDSKKERPAGELTTLSIMISYAAKNSADQFTRSIKSQSGYKISRSALIGALLDLASQNEADMDMAKVVSAETLKTELIASINKKQKPKSKKKVKPSEKEGAAAL